MTVDPQRISQTIHDLIHPWTPMNPGGDPVAAENFAGLVDAIAEISTVYTPNGNSVETLYGQLVQANTPVTAPGIPPAPVPSSPHPRPVVPLPPWWGSTGSPPPRPESTPSPTDDLDPPSMRVMLDRPWLRLALLSRDGWSVPGRTRGDPGPGPSPEPRARVLGAGAEESHLD